MSQDREPGLYIQMFSIHGLLRSENMELGYDADTGGQIKYVIELCRALSLQPEVRKVELFTRLIQDKSYSEDYSRRRETVTEKFDIIRIRCGGGKYIKKEQLWPFMDEFVDNAIKYIQQGRQVPDLVHGHYPDGGYVAKELARFFGIPFVYTGHSLGRSKKHRLLAQGLDEADMNRKLKIDHRIQTEETILKQADLIVTSTRQEVEGQYGLYRNKSLPAYRIIPPGIGLDKFYPYYQDEFSDHGEKEMARFTKASLQQELERFFRHSDKPLILVLCRPDKRKNIQGLVRAYGEDLQLQAMANLAVFAGIRRDITIMAHSEERDVLTLMLLLLDKYNLYGKMAIPKQHDFESEVPELYRIAAEKKGVFVNPALTEPFGITLLEALACGLPVVATNDGGPRDIIHNTGGGVLVDPTDPGEISQAIRQIISSETEWAELSKSGILNTRRFYTWESHTQTYAKEITALCRDAHQSTVHVRTPRHSIGRRLKQLDRILITDIDNTLLGGNPEDLEALKTFVEDHTDHMGFGVATGRDLNSAVSVLREHQIPLPDIVISSVGSRIDYGADLTHDRGWETHIRRNWKPERIQEALADLAFLEPQDTNHQGPYKLSYYMDPGKDRISRIHHLLTQNRFQYSLIYSHERYLDILPYRASKGKALRYISYKWEIPLDQFLVCGDSGNDAEMLKGDNLGVVVSNFSPELAELKNAKRIYFAQGSHARGILEGIDHYKFLEQFTPLNEDAGQP